MYQVWQKGLAKRNTRQREWAVKVAAISELDSRLFPELQAADLMAWLINKYHTLRLTAGDSDNVSRYVKKISRNTTAKAIENIVLKWSAFARIIRLNTKGTDGRCI